MNEIIPTVKVEVDIIAEIEKYKFTNVKSGSSAGQYNDILSECQRVIKLAIGENK